MELKNKPQNLSKVVVISGVSFHEDRNNKPFARCILSDKTAEFPAVFWQIPDGDKKLLEENSVLLVNASLSDYQGAVQYTINSLYQTNDYDAEDLVFYDIDDRESWYNRLVAMANKFSNENLKAITLSLLTEEKEFLLTGAAAMSMHHARPGGLLRHVCEMITIASSVRSFYPVVNFDLVTAGIIFHDIAKKQEYKFNDFGGATGFDLDGHLFGHVYLGTQVLKEHADKCGVPQDSLEVKMLEHIILAHHGELEYGSPVQPATIEALLVHHVDNLDARLYQYNKTLETTPVGETGKLFGKKVVFNHGL